MTLTVAQLITETCQGLQTVDAPRLEAQLLVAQALGRDRAWLYAHGEDPAPEDVIQQVRQWALRRSAGEPAAYLLGRREFWSLDLKVGPEVLIPRPDTEILVEAALSHLDEDSNASILDLGTGSGAIALALATERPKARITATDRSPLALGVAADNARHLGLNTRIQWLDGSWYDPLGDTRFDMIVSNPPYVAEADPHLGQLGHEPREALVSGADGLDDLRQIVAGAPDHLLAGGWLLVEHGADQGGGGPRTVPGSRFVTGGHTQGPGRAGAGDPRLPGLKPRDGKPAFFVLHIPGRPLALASWNPQTTHTFAIGNWCSGARRKNRTSWRPPG
ncbi:peptide chain release factor N(5)-glutamine methyltransferase [Ectothiorhodospira haloalkaliphila]|uniref:peptide chain release factor N(5)-glutamine methyltransferase n=1 Tax=Ectothiorhodospira haloalkaliphila TaxID=421628 RepID=UPI0004BCC8CE|nr:peptide chain release factor N(5)-glutamine methyltransferase [Ectothiorhodospira haloalkaliphila]